MGNKKKITWTTIVGDIIGCIFVFGIFVIPFLFMLTTALKDRKGANTLAFSIPEVFHWDNFLTVIQNNHYQLLTAFMNTILITAVSCGLILIVASMGGFVIQRRSNKITRLMYTLLMTGMMVPFAIMPTIWLLKGINLYKTKTSMILLMTCMQLPFATMLYRSFATTIPTQLDEAAAVDGVTPLGLYTRIVFPLLKPVHASVIICCAVAIYNDFEMSLYFLPGAKNVTVQLTLYNYMGKFQSSYNLMFANVILAFLPMLILFIIFNNKIVDGMVVGAVKG